MYIIDIYCIIIINYSFKLSTQMIVTEISDKYKTIGIPIISI